MRVFLLLMLLSSPAVAHEFVPTYPTLRPSFVDAVLVFDMTLINKRQDVEYYEVGVFDEDFNDIVFRTNGETLRRVPFLARESYEFYIRESDRYKTTYVCSWSKLLKNQETTRVSSKICSKIK